MVYQPAHINSETFELLRSPYYTPSASLRSAAPSEREPGMGAYHSTSRPETVGLRAIFIAPTKGVFRSSGLYPSNANKKIPVPKEILGTRTEWIFCGTTLFAAGAATSCRRQHVRCLITPALRQKILSGCCSPCPRRPICRLAYRPALSYAGLSVGATPALLPPHRFLNSLFLTIPHHSRFVNRFFNYAPGWFPYVGALAHPASLLRWKPEGFQGGEIFRVP